MSGRTPDACYLPSAMEIRRSWALFLGCLLEEESALRSRVSARLSCRACLSTLEYELRRVVVKCRDTGIAVTIDPVTVKIANWLLIRQPEQ